MNHLLQTAIEQHRRGELASADKSYRKILATAPGHPDALHLWGVLAHQTGRVSAAIDAMRKAEPAHEANAVFHFNLARVLADAGQFNEAMRRYRKAIVLRPKLIEAYQNLAVMLLDLGAPLEAAHVCRQGLEISPHEINLLRNLGLAFERANQPERARETYRHLVDRHPQYATGHLRLGTLHYRLGQLDEAAESLQRAIAVDATLVPAYNNLGQTRQAQQRDADAVACYEQALKIDPQHFEVLVNLGTAYKNRNATDAAVRCYRRAMTIRPDAFQTWYNLGILYEEQGDVSRADDCFEKALTACTSPVGAARTAGGLSPGMDGPHTQRRQGVQARDTGPTIEAKDPPQAKIRAQRALLWLRQGRLSEGWPEYEFRTRLAAHGTAWLSDVAAWRGEPVADKTLLIHAEQGVGDQILFASCLPTLTASGARLILTCQPRLVPLFSRSFPGTTVLPAQAFGSKSLRGMVAKVNFQIAAGSLPRHLRGGFESFPETSGYLVASAPRVAHWRAQLSRSGKPWSIGFSWRGGGKPKEARRRSTRLDAWTPVLKHANIHWVNLQYGTSAAELATTGQRFGVEFSRFPAADPLIDLDEFAALVAALDFVISIDNTTVHVAGALGVPTWVLLPHVATWYWFANRGDSPWYPSLRLLRQPRRGDWTTVFEHLEHALSERFGRTAGPF